MAKNDHEILNEFTRVLQVHDGVVIEVCTITWNGPHSPESAWIEARRLPPTASDAEVVRARKKLLNRRCFFQNCIACGERNPRGWMHGDICQTCAERNHGVVH